MLDRETRQRRHRKDGQRGHDVHGIRLRNLEHKEQTQDDDYYAFVIDEYYGQREDRTNRAGQPHGNPRWRPDTTKRTD